MIKLLKSQLVWSYFAFFINLSFGVILLPFLLKYLSVQELGLWYIFNAISTFVLLLDFGFSPSISRNISYAWGGAENLFKDGIDFGKIINSPNVELISKLSLVSKKVYSIISFFTLLFLFFFGTFYINMVGNKVGNHLLSWFIYIVSVFLNIRVSFRIPILKGIGKIKESQKSIVISKIIQLVLTIAGLMFNLNLIAISIAYLISGFVLQLLSKHYLNINSTINKSISIDNEETKNLFLKIWHNSKKSGIVSVGAFFITQSSILLSSYFLDLEITAKYGFTMQLINILIALSSTYYLINLPKLSIAILNKNIKKQIEIISIGCFINWVLYFIGSLFLFFLLPICVNYFNYNINIIEKNYLLFMLVYLFLENNHSMFASFISCENKIPFVKSSLISGFAILAFSLLSLKFTRYGIFGLMFSQFFVQLCYNNWKWPLYVFKNYKVSLFGIFKTGYNLIIYDRSIFSKSHNSNSNI